MSEVLWHGSTLISIQKCILTYLFVFSLSHKGAFDKIRGVLAAYVHSLKHVICLLFLYV